MNTQTTTMDKQCLIDQMKLRTVKYGTDDIKKAIVPFDTLGKEMMSKLPHVNGKILVLSDIGILCAMCSRLKEEGMTFDEILFACHTGQQQAFANSLGIKTINIGYKNPIQELETQLMGMKFDIIVGNPPFDGKSSIHLKLLGKMESLIKYDGFVSLILPKPILARHTHRINKHTSWIDGCTMQEWSDIDMQLHFPKVQDFLIWFIFKNDNGSKMVDLTIFPPKKWIAKYASGLHYATCKKKPDGEYNIPVINCVNDNGKPTFGKFTTRQAVEELNTKQNFKGKNLLHINSAGSMAHRTEIAWLDTEGTYPFYNHYMDTFMFDSERDAQECFNWIKSDEGKKYFNDWLKCGWGVSAGLELMFGHQKV